MNQLISPDTALGTWKRRWTFTFPNYGCEGLRSR